MKQLTPLYEMREALMSNEPEAKNKETPDPVSTQEVITSSDVQSVDASALFGGGSNPFGTPPKEGESDDVFSVGVPTDNGFRVQKGKQPLKLVDLGKSVSRANNPMWVWTFVVLLGKDAGRELKVFTALTAAAMWKLRETLAAVQVKGAEGGAAAKFKRSDVIGKYVMADVEDTMYEGRPASNVAKLYAVRDEDVPRIEIAAKAALTNSGKASPF